MFKIVNTETNEVLVLLAVSEDKRQIRWGSKNSMYAITFDESEEAQATIDFIANALDWELGEQLEVVQI